MDLDHETARLLSSCASLASSCAPPAFDNAGEPRVAILLSTFNGEQYVSEQLRSYSAQTQGHWRLYWRDDGSTDGTSAIMAAFVREAGEGRCVRLPKGGKLRATASFLSLLRTALRGDAAFFAFSDQDDVWLPEKLAHAVAALGGVPANRPALYFCGRTLVDSMLRPIGPAPMLRRPPGFPAALTQNVIPGCCMIFNRAAAELIDQAQPPDTTWHDWWCYLVVSAGDGLVIAGDTADILYSQHAGNLVGEPLRSGPAPRRRSSVAGVLSSVFSGAMSPRCRLVQDCWRIERPRPWRGSSMPPVAACWRVPKRCSFLVWSGKPGWRRSCFACGSYWANRFIIVSRNRHAACRECETGRGMSLALVGTRWKGSRRLCRIPAITAIIPLYNGAAFIKEALEQCPEAKLYDPPKSSSWMTVQRITVLTSSLPWRVSTRSH